MVNEACSKIQQVCMEIWNSKSSSNMYSKFKVKFGALLEVNFRQAKYYFEAWEVRNPTLQMVYKSKLKRGSHMCLKQTS